MSYKPYPTYKDSGVEWLGEIPEGWDLKRLKWSTTSVKNGVWGDEAKGDDHDLACIRVADFDRRNQSVDESNLTFRNIAPSDLQGRLLEKGDLLIEKSGGGENWPVGYVVQFNHSFPAVTSNFIARVSLSTYANGSFFKYFHLSLYSARVTTRSINQTSGIQNLDSTSYFNNLAVFPPLFTQKVIAAFLDAKTARIDGLVRDYEELIALLSEKRQALVSHAVTRGLSELVSPDDPDFGEWALPVAFKDSGVEWLGEIPEGWGVYKSRRLFAQRKERAEHSDEMITASQKYGMIFQREFMELEDQKVVQVLKDFDILKKVKCNDFVMSMRSFQGGLELSRIEGCMSSAYIALIPSSEINVEYFKWLFKCGRYIQGLQSTTNLVRDGQALRYDNFVKLELPLLSQSEQKAIAAFLDRETAKIDSLVAEAEGAIELLKERRSALITAAVTGKINVEEMEVVQP